MRVFMRVSSVPLMKETSHKWQTSTVETCLAIWRQYFVILHPRL